MLQLRYCAFIFLFTWSTDSSLLLSQENASNFIIDHWTTETGLPSNDISQIWKTGDNYMWFRSPQGLIRFDGSSFSLINNGNNPAFQRAVFGQVLTRNTTDEFWINNEAAQVFHLIRYKNGVFHYHPLPEEKSGVPLTKNFHFSIAEAGDFWVVSDRRLFRFKHGNFVEVRFDEISSPVIGIKAQEATLWIATEKGFYAFKDESIIDSISVDNSGLQDFLLADNQIWTISESHLSIQEENIHSRFPLPNALDPYSEIILQKSPQAPKGIVINAHPTAYLFQHKKFSPIPHKEVITPAQIYPDEKGWKKVGSGIYYKNELVFELSQDQRIHMYVDDLDHLWLGTHFDGLYRVRKNLFNHYDKEDSVKNIYPLFETLDGSVWGGHLRRIFYQFKEGQSYSHSYAYQQELGRAHAFYEYKNGQLLFGTRDGIGIFDPLSKSLDQFPTPFDSSFVYVKVLQEDSVGNLLVGSKKGLYKYSLRDQVWEKIPTRVEEGVFIEQLHQANSGRTWIGTFKNGLYELVDETLIPVSFNSSLSGRNIRSIYEDTSGVLWVGFGGEGLNRVDLSDGTVTPIKLENGLYGSFIHTILEDDFNRLWMSSNQGIFWIYKDRLTAFAEGRAEKLYPIVYQKEDGLPGNEANGGAQFSGLETSDGRLWFAMLDGVANVNPKDVNISSLNFPVRIERITTAERTIEEQADTLFLNQSERSLYIKFTAFNYTIKPENIQFTYRLNDVDEQWVEARTQRSATYTNLKPGEYKFRLKAGMGGRWDQENRILLMIYVEPYFYETALFKSLISFLVLSGFGILGFWVFRKKEIEAEEYEVALQDQEILKTERELFLEPLQKYIESELTSKEINVDHIAGIANMSRAQFYRKIKEYTGLTPAGYIREIRLLKANELIKSKSKGTISEVSFAVGFSKPSHFTSLFKKRFGVHPKELM